MEQFYVHKVLNNNVILARGENGRETVLVGKGLGFHARTGEKVAPEKIEKAFYFFDEHQYAQYKTIIDRVDSRILGLTEEIIAMAARELAEPLHEHIHVALADHINFTLERLANQLEITNPFLEEIKALYPREYALASRAAAMITEKMHVAIPDGEKGFIAMHIHAAKANHAVSRTVKHTSIINKLVEIIEEGTGIRLDTGDTGYARLVVHLRFALDRIEKNICVQNPLLDRIKKEFARSYRIAEQAGAFIEQRLGKAPPKDELGYLAMHIQRLISGNF